MAEQPLRYFKLRSRAKYEVVTALEFATGIESAGFELPFGGISPAGVAWCSGGFVWDGPSGPTHDRLWNQKASAKHDLLVKLLRHTGFGDPETHKERQLLSDRIYRASCFEAIATLWEMAPRRTAWQRFMAGAAFNQQRALARVHYAGLRVFGSSAGDIEGPREVLVAP